MNPCWMLLGCVAFVAVSLVNAETAQSDPSDPEGTLALVGFDPIERSQHYASTPEDGHNVHVYKIFKPEPSSPAAITVDGALREFRYYANSRSGLLLVELALLKEVPNHPGKMKVMLAATQTEVGREDEEFWLEQLTAEMWDTSNDGRVNAGMLLALCVQKVCDDNLNNRGGVSYELGTPAECGTTYTYRGHLGIDEIVPKSELFANPDAQCMKASVQIVVDL